MKGSQTIFATILLQIFISAAAKELEWWEGGNFYQIYPRSFMDSNGDGVGDLQGIKSKVAYVKELGMDGVWLSPIMKSPQADFGYDISDYRDIHWEYGTLDDFQELLDECNRVGLKLIMDFVPNHTSDEHEWFVKSENREPGFENFFTWHPGSFDPITGKRIPPNNWISQFQYSSWKWSPIRKQFYLHQFLYQQPDLNYRNKKVVEEMKQVLVYWLTKGIQGFRIDAVPYLFEVKQDQNGNYPDEPLTGSSCPNPDDYCHTEHIFTRDREETFDMIFQWRSVVDEFSASHDKNPKVIMTEAYSSLDNMIRFYGDGRRNGSHVPFNFDLISNVDKASTAEDYKLRIDNWLTRVPKGSHANWVLGNHDQHRLATRLGVERTDLINIMLQTLPGIAVTYQGEEMGLVNTHLAWEETIDPWACNTDPDRYEPFSRDPSRTPFPWDDTKNAGFTSADMTWLPLSPDYATNNVAYQTAQPNSHLKIFKELTKLRKHPVLRQGDYEGKLVNEKNVLIYRRWYGEEDLVVVILNFGNAAETVNVKEAFPEITESELLIYTCSLNTSVEGTNTDLTNVIVPGNKALVLSTVTNQ